MSFNRHQVRELAFKVLFAQAANEAATDTDLYDQLLGDKQVPDYLKELVDGVHTNMSDINAKISVHLASNWTIQRIAKTDLIVLQIAIYEISFVDDVPAKVAIDEALELTKTYSDDRSRKFVNGILGKLVDEDQK